MGAEDADALEQSRVLLEVEELVRGEPPALYLAGLAILYDLDDFDEAVCAWKRQRTEQHPVDDAEDGCRGADAECQRQHRDGGKPGIAAESANRYPCIAQQRFHHRFDSVLIDVAVPE